MRRIAQCMAALCAAFAVAGCAPARAADAPAEAAFLWREANALMSSATNAADCVRAAEKYQRLADMGVRNGSVFYNMGTALLRAGACREALAVLERAERYEGAAPDVLTNLRIAAARKAGLDQAALPWSRYLLFWHFRMGCPLRTAVAAAAFCALWLLCALRLLVRVPGFRSLLAGALIVLAAFGSSAATSLYQELNAAPPPFAKIRATLDGR